MTDIEQELIAILNQLPAAIEKAVLDVLVLRHGTHDQKTHGRRHGTTGLREFAGKRGFQVREIKGKDGRSQYAITDKNDKRTKMRAGGLTEARKLIQTTNRQRRDKAIDARGKSPKELNQRQLAEAFSQAKTAKRRAEVANEIFGRSGFADKTVAKVEDEIPSTWESIPRPSTISAHGKLAVFKDDNDTFYIAPVIRNQEGEYYTGALGRTRRVKPEFVG